MTFRNPAGARRIAALLVAGGLLWTGCSQGAAGGDGDAKERLIEALRGSLETEAVTSDVTLLSTTDSVQALLSKDGQELDDEQAEKVLDSTLVVSERGIDPDETQSELLLDIAGTEALHVKEIDNDAYVRADLDALDEVATQDLTQLEQLAGQVRGQPGFEWIDAALNGDWLVIKDVDDLERQFGGESAPEPRRLVEGVLDIVEEHATVTDDGEEDPGTHLSVTFPIKETARDLSNLLGDAAGPIPGVPDLGADVEDLPDGDIEVDLWVDGETITQAEFDLLQLNALAEDDDRLPEGVSELGVRMTFAEWTGSVSPEPDAVEVDAAAIMQGLSAFGGGASGAGTGTDGAFDCGQLKGAPPQVIELYAKECPELQKP